MRRKVGSFHIYYLHIPICYVCYLSTLQYLCRPGQIENVDRDRFYFIYMLHASRMHLEEEKEQTECNLIKQRNNNCTSHRPANIRFSCSACKLRNKCAWFPINNIAHLIGSLLFHTPTFTYK